MAEQELILTTIRLPVPLHERLRREAYETRLSQAEIVRLALEEYFDRREAGNK